MNRIKFLREESKLTVRELSQKSGVAVGYLSTLENDKLGLTNPSKEVMEKISTALGATVPDVFYPEKTA